MQNPGFRVDVCADIHPGENSGCYRFILPPPTNSPEEQRAVQELVDRYLQVFKDLRKGGCA